MLVVIGATGQLGAKVRRTVLDGAAEARGDRLSGALSCAGRATFLRGRSVKSLLLAALLLASTAATADVNCSRSELQVAVKAYLEAQKAGDRSLLPTVPATLYYEQQVLIEARDSIVNKALAVDFRRSILDEASCQTFTELIVLDEKHPYVIGTRLRLVAGTVMELEAMVTDEGDWMFNPQVTFDHSSTESWDVLAPVERVDRATLEAAANAYFDQFFSGPNTVYVPWGSPCNRLEGGAYIGDGSATDSCNVDVPSGLNISGRRFVVDEAMGAIVGFARFGPNRIPDTHLFRLANGKIRYVHTLTVCPKNGCQFFRLAE